MARRILPIIVALVASTPAFAQTGGPKAPDGYPGNSERNNQCAVVGAQASMQLCLLPSERLVGDDCECPGLGRGIVPRKNP